jgi:hypothetical protein
MSAQELVEHLLDRRGHRPPELNSAAERLVVNYMQATLRTSDHAIHARRALAVIDLTRDPSIRQAIIDKYELVNVERAQPPTRVHTRTRAMHGDRWRH